MIKHPLRDYFVGDNSSSFKKVKNRKVEGVFQDSRQVKENSIFFAIKGLNRDGHNFVNMAIEKGAIAIVHSDDLPKKEGIYYYKTEDVLGEMNRISNMFYDFPSEKLDVYAVTGTNGKTTTSYIIDSLLSNFEPSAYNGTVGLKINGKSLTGEHYMTTPDNISLTETLQKVVSSGCKSIAMEFSSHALDQRRADNVDVDVAIFTNLTWEHINYHKTMENYFKAKARLFENLGEDKVVILNIDDAYYHNLRKLCHCKVLTYGFNPEADFSLRDIKTSLEGTTFVLVYDKKEYVVETNLMSQINAVNLTAAIAALVAIGKPVGKVIEYAKNISMEIGRFEIYRGDKTDVLVDFAHTPDGFDKVFSFAREVVGQEGKVIGVFSSAGGRDQEKRSIMGEIGEKYCDHIILTEEDPCNESVESINAQILEGIKEKSKVEEILDRYKAMETAVDIAEKGDLVVVLGKAHDMFMSREEDEYWMGDHIAAKKLLGIDQ